MDFQPTASSNRFALSDEDRTLLVAFITKVPNWRAYVGFILESKSKLGFRDLAIKMRDFDFENTSDVEDDCIGEIEAENEVENDDESGLEFTSMDACDCNASDDCRVCKYFRSVQASSNDITEIAIDSEATSATGVAGDFNSKVAVVSTAADVCVSEADSSSDKESEVADSDSETTAEDIAANEEVESDQKIVEIDDAGVESDDAVVESDETGSEFSSGNSDCASETSAVGPGSPIKLEPSISEEDQSFEMRGRFRDELVPLQHSSPPSPPRMLSPRVRQRAPVKTQAADGLNSHNQGKYAERNVCSVLQENLPFGFDVRACGATANSADIRVSCGRSTVLIDVKNYNTSKVSVNEQNKLVNDVYRDPSVDGGIMLCVGKRGCTNISERFTMTKLHNTTDGTKPVLIVHTGDPDLITQSVLFMAMITAELRHIRGQSFDPDASEEEKREVPNETRSLCVQALRKMTRIQTINDHADTIMQSACQIRSESTILKDELRNLFSGAGFVVGGDSSFDFNKKKFPKRYSEILRSMCEIKPPVLINRGARNVFDFGSRGFVRITTQKVTHSFSLDTPVSKWVDLVEHAAKQQQSDSDSK